MLTSETCKVVRSWLGWDQATLASRAGIGRNTLSLFENGHGAARRATVYAIERAFEQSGIKFDQEAIVVDEQRLPDLLGYRGKVKVMHS